MCARKVCDYFISIPAFIKEMLSLMYIMRIIRL